jgi:hypothetical protein
VIPPRPFAAHGVGVGRLRGAPVGPVAAPCGRWSALHCAAIYNHAEVTSALLLAGATEGIKDKYGYGSRFRAGACEPKGRAPADAACSKTAEDAANDRGKSAAYAAGVKRVRLPAHPQAQPCVRARARRIRGGVSDASAGVFRVRALCAWVRVCVYVMRGCVRVCLRVRAPRCATRTERTVRRPWALLGRSVR